MTFPLILLSLAPTCSGCRKCQDFGEPSSREVAAAEQPRRHPNAFAWCHGHEPQVAPGACQAAQSLGSHPRKSCLAAKEQQHHGPRASVEQEGATIPASTRSPSPGAHLPWGTSTLQTSMLLGARNSIKTRWQTLTK